MTQPGQDPLIGSWLNGMVFYPNGSVGNDGTTTWKNNENQKNSYFVIARTSGGVDWNGGRTVDPSVSSTEWIYDPVTDRISRHGSNSYWISRGIPKTTIPTPAPIIKRIFPQPMTGTIIKGSPMNGGYGEFTINNKNGGSDAVATLTYAGQKKSLISVYIRKGTSYTIQNIWDGDYELYTVMGENWNPESRKFENYSRYTRFEDTIPFVTTATHYKTWEVTLYPVVGGTAETEVVSQNDFPDL